MFNFIGSIGKVIGGVLVSIGMFFSGGSIDAPKEQPNYQQEIINNQEVGSTTINDLDDRSLESKVEGHLNQQTNVNPIINTPLEAGRITQPDVIQTPQLSERDVEKKNINDYLNDYFSKKMEEADEELERFEKEWDEMQEKLEPVNKEINNKLEDLKEKCDAGVFRTGYLAQECNQISADIQNLSVDIREIQNEYIYNTGLYPDEVPKINLQTDINSGYSFYKIYYDGNGNGKIYNMNNISDNYSFYCKNNSCDIYGF